MLQNKFFTITNKNQVSDNEISTEIKINSEHKIFNGHFPNNPVVPGVVSVQIINEILSEHLSLQLTTSKARSIKFSSMINPNINSKLNVNIIFLKNDNKNYKVKATINYEETTFLKFNGIFSSNIN